MANCPKCNKKLNPFYFKQNCPHCGANLMYYNLEERLNEDAASAQAEWDNVAKLLDGIKRSAIGSVFAVLRIAAYFLSVLALLLPVYRPENTELYGDDVSLISFIKIIINDASGVFEDTVMLVMLVSFACVILLTLLSLIVSLFSYTKNGFVRNMIFSVLDIAVFIGLSVGVAVCGGGISYSFYLVIVFMAAAAALSIMVNKKLKEK